MKNKTVKLWMVILLLPAAVLPQGRGKAPQQAKVEIRKTSLSKDQQIQLGKEAAAEVERTMEVIKNPEIEAWLNRIGQNLARQPQANAFPYYFKLLNDESINAFALPGGPMFVHTGLIRAADNEAQVAGVLAHEMSHVALQHGASQMSKAQTWGMIGGILGAIGGVAGGGTCGLLCQATQIGGGLLTNGVLMKFSRDMEHDADLNGARMAASAGYNPVEFAHFFEKLEKQMGAAGQQKGISNWFASHPSPGNRVQYVTEDIGFYPQKSYTADSGNFEQVKRAAGAIPPPKPQPAQLLAPKQGAQPRSGLPSGYQDLQATGFAIAYPGDWKAGTLQGSSSLYLVPQNGVKQGQQGGGELILGAMIDYYRPQGQLTLEAATRELLDGLAKGDQAMRTESPRQTVLGGKPGLMTRLTTRTSDGQDQTVYFYTVMRDNLLWNMALAAPSSQAPNQDATFRQIARTVAFPD